MKIAKQTVIMLTILGTSPTAFAVWDMPMENFIASIDATATKCKKIDPAGVKHGLDLLQKKLSPQQKAILPTIRNSDTYKTAYAEEVTRLSALSSSEREQACKNAW